MADAPAALRNRTRCLVCGAGDVGSAVAHALFNAGYAVALVDGAAPGYTRRGMAFVDAFFEGRAELGGVLAKKARGPDGVLRMLECRRALPAFVGDAIAGAALLQPSVLVDARMRKRARPETQMHVAPITIGIGPNFEAGLQSLFAIESAWGDHLGDVLERGRTSELAGEPREIGGSGRERFVYAARAGAVEAIAGIGDNVTAGETVAYVDGDPVRSPMAGCIRGLPHTGAWIEAGAKVLEIDPRGKPELVRGIGERPARIAQGVMRAVESALGR